MPLTRRHGGCGLNPGLQWTQPTVAFCPHAKGSSAGRSAELGGSGGALRLNVCHPRLVNGYESGQKMHPKPWRI